MKSIGIVICNFNKKDYIINCIKSILKQSIDDFDIYVVDNASTDDSVEMIRKEFGDLVNLIVNKVNLGGSGGFNTGMKKVLEKDYKYLMCVDNDIIMDSKNVEELYSFLENNNDIALVGSKIYKMDEPEIVMAFGSKINYDTYEYQDNFKGCKDNDEIPKMLYCDYVPACSLMVRTSVIRKIGLMKESNFIYWDDIDWAFRMKEAGYKVAAISKAKIWHKGGGTNPVNTFPDYYFWRNKITFFAEHLKEEEIGEFIDTLLKQIFQYIYGSYYKGKTNLIKTIMYAYDDAIHGITGKAEEYKILKRISGDEINILQEKLYGIKEISIELPNNFCLDANASNNSEKIFLIGNLIDILKLVFNINDELSIKLLNLSNRYSVEEIKKEINNRLIEEKLKESFKIKILEEDNLSSDLKIKICNHVTEIEEIDGKSIYIDKFNNCVVNEEQFKYYKNYDNMFNIFKTSNRELLKSQINKLRINRL